MPDSRSLLSKLRALKNLSSSGNGELVADILDELLGSGLVFRRGRSGTIAISNEKVVFLDAYRAGLPNDLERLREVVRSAVSYFPSCPQIYSKAFCLLEALGDVRGIRDSCIECLNSEEFQENGLFPDHSSQFKEQHIATESFFLLLRNGRIDYAVDVLSTLDMLSWTGSPFSSLLLEVFVSVCKFKFENMDMGPKGFSLLSEEIKSRCCSRKCRIIASLAGAEARRRRRVRLFSRVLDWLDKVSFVGRRKLPSGKVEYRKQFKIF